MDQIGTASPLNHRFDTIRIITRTLRQLLGKPRTIMELQCKEQQAGGEIILYFTVVTCPMR